MGRGRMSAALAAALGADATVDIAGRGADGTVSDGSVIDRTTANAVSTVDLVLLAVPDSAIAEAARAIGPGPLVAHLSGATGLDALGSHEGFSLHPLLTVTGASSAFAGAFAAVDGTSERALAAAEALAERLGLRTFRVAERDRAAYHAAASVAANFLVTIEGLAERLAATAGVPREALAPLAGAALDNWARDGAAASLTGPIARGDDETVARQRAAVAERTDPSDLELFDALVAATRARRTPPERPPMKIVRSVQELRRELAEARTEGRERVGFVPTMGALHEGHLSLVRAARAESDVVVLSIFVNPTQFTEAADLSGYPRQEAADAALAAEAGVDLVFAPDAAEIYPSGFATTVHLSGALTETLEGASRGGAHFDGVATVVAKLLLAVQADSAYFGQKDAQQVLVVTRMVADLGIPTRIVACPTSRDADGLARSSRNVRLSPEDRSRALAIPRALAAAADAVRGGEASAETVRRLATGILAEAGIEPEYLALVDPATLEPVHTMEAPVLFAVAARVGEVRLIDNAVIEPAGH